MLVQCKATTSSSVRCKAKPHKDWFCFFHSDPKKAAELGRKGGRRNWHTYETPLQPLAAPESAADVKRMLAKSMAEVRAGKMDPKLGTTLAYIGTLRKRLDSVEDRVELQQHGTLYANSMGLHRHGRSYGRRACRRASVLCVFEITDYMTVIIGGPGRDRSIHAILVSVSC